MTLSLKCLWSCGWDKCGSIRRWNSGLVQHLEVWNRRRVLSWEVWEVWSGRQEERQGIWDSRNVSRGREELVRFNAAKRPNKAENGLLTLEWCRVHLSESCSGQRWGWKQEKVFPCIPFHCIPANPALSWSVPSLLIHASMVFSQNPWMIPPLPPASRS